jgi:DNA-binding MarR family transcriptional regulator
MGSLSDEQVQAIGYHLREIAHMLKRHLAVLLASEGLTLPQMLVLRRVKEKGEVTLGEIAADLHLAPSTLSDIIKRLERDGLVEKASDPRDMRVIRLRMLEKGKDLLARTCSIYNRHLRNILAHFEEPEVEALSRSLARLREYVAAEDPNKLVRRDRP